MDKMSSDVREYLAKRADLLGAIRLPKNSFSNTEVTTDIIFLQKREEIREELPDWVKTEEYFTNVQMNKYFIEHPEMVMGEIKETTNQFGADLDVVLKDTDNLKDMLTEAVNHLPLNVLSNTQINNINSEQEDDMTIPAEDGVKDYSYTIVDNKVYYRENSIMTKQTYSSTTEDRVKGLIKVRDTLRELIDIQCQDVSDEEIEPYTKKLNKEYDKFVKKYGFINSKSNKNVFREDSEYPLLSALEDYNDITKLLKKRLQMNIKKEI